MAGQGACSILTPSRNFHVRADLDPVGAAKLLVATSQGLMVIGKANPDESVLRAIVDNAFAGLAPP